MAGSGGGGAGLLLSALAVSDVLRVQCARLHCRVCLHYCCDGAVSIVCWAARAHAPSLRFSRDLPVATVTQAAAVLTDLSGMGIVRGHIE